MKSTTATYVFCIVRAPKAPAMTRVPEALPEMGKARALAAGKGVWLIVADAPLSLYGEATLNEKLKDMDWVSRCALAHEQIIEFASRAPAVLPMKLFTLFNSDERALRLVEADPKRIARALDRVEGCAEYGVRLSIDELRARRQAEVRAAEQSRGSSGAAFLMRKKTLKEASAELTRGARDVGDELFETLSKLVVDARRRGEVEGLSPGARLVMDGVFLVENSRAASFKTAVESASKELAGRGYDLVLNGPWPAYHFVADAA